MSTDFACVGCGVDLSTSGRIRTTRLPVCDKVECKPAMLVRIAKAAQPKVLPVAKLPRERRNDPRLGVLDGGKWAATYPCTTKGCPNRKPIQGGQCYSCSQKKTRTVLRPDERVAA